MKFKNIFAFFKSGKFWMNLSGISAFIILFLIGSLWGLDLYTRHGQGIEVPDIKGMLASDAEFKLRGENLEALIVDSDYVKNLPPGIILEQTPRPGMKVKRNRTIYLTVNASNSPTLVIPDLADNASVRQARVKLTAMGFKLGPNEYIDGEKDWLYAIKYRGRKVYAGDRVPCDATLVLVVGSGIYGGDGGDSISYSIDDIGDYSTDADISRTNDSPKSDKKDRTPAQPAKENKPEEWF